MDTNLPSTPRCRKQLTRDQRLQVHALRDNGLSYSSIAKELQISKRQVQYTLEKGSLTPTKRSGRPPVLSREQVDELERFVTSSRTAGEMSHFELAHFQFRSWNVSERVIRKALHSRGHNRRATRANPPQDHSTQAVG
ncbi:hypothetical protein K3495_g4768 [Podosphaera aphanis]|nr:hypothetical protein K3495_g4768 [Podosphaera aphanis]